MEPERSRALACTGLFGGFWSGVIDKRLSYHGWLGCTRINAAIEFLSVAIREIRGPEFWLPIPLRLSVFASLR